MGHQCLQVKLKVCYHFEEGFDPHSWYICDLLLLFYKKNYGNVDGLIGGEGGQRICWLPSSYLGEGLACPDPTAPPPPYSYAYDIYET